MENMPENTRVGRVEAVDKDLSPYNSFSYSLDGNYESAVHFQIHRFLGIITTRRELDREQKKSHNIIVIATSDSFNIRFKNIKN